MPTVYSPPVNTYTPLASITLASATSSVTLTGISQDYRDLVAVISGALTNNTSTDVLLRVNGDSAGNYSRVQMYGDGASTSSFSQTSQTHFYPMYQRDDVSTAIIQFMDYSTTDKHKTVLIRTNDAADLGVSASAQRWANTAAINSISFTTTNNFTAGYTFSLFGIEA